MKWKPMAKKLALAFTIGVSSMYVGDKMDFERNYLIPTKDYVMGIETAEGFADQSSVDIVTIINEDDMRESYLSYDEIEGGRVQTTPISDNGYAVPESLTDRISDYIGSRIEELKELESYESFEKMRDKLGVMVDYYTIQAKEFLDDNFGGD